MGPIETIYDGITQKVSVMWNYIYIAHNLTNIITGITIILLAWEGYKIFYGRTAGQTLSSSIVLIIKYAVVMSLVSSYDFYESSIVTIFTEIPDAIAKMFYLAGPTGGNETVFQEGGSIAQSLDDFLVKAADYGWSLGGITEVGQAMLGIIIVLLAVVVSIVSILQLAICEIGIKIFLILGPFVLVAFMFPQTKGIFEGWLRVLITFAITKILVLIIIKLTLQSFGAAVEAMASNRDDNSASYIVTFIVYTILMIILLLKSPDFASQMGGGLALATNNLAAGAMERGRGLVTGGLRGAVGARSGYQAAQETGKNRVTGTVAGALVGVARESSIAYGETSDRAKRAVAALGGGAARSASSASGSSTGGAAAPAAGAAPSGASGVVKASPSSDAARAAALVTQLKEKGKS